MTARRVRAARLALVVAAALAGAGCAGGRSLHDTAGGCLPPGRSLVVARVVNHENRANGEAAADLLVNALKDSGAIMGGREFLGEAKTTGLGLWASDMTERVQRGGGASAEDGRTLAERFDIRTIVTVDLTEYDQVWGKYAKFTRAAVDAQAVDPSSDRVLWRYRGDTEVEDMRGRAFRFAMEQAVQDVAGSICPRRSFSLTNTWRSFRR